LRRCAEHCDNEAESCQQGQHEYFGRITDQSPGPNGGRWMCGIQKMRCWSFPQA
jgi:hypothetical protein